MGVKVVQIYSTHMSPAFDGLVSLGQATVQWNNLWVTGKAYIDGVGESVLFDSVAQLQFRDTSTYIYSSGAGYLTFVATVGLGFTADCWITDGKNVVVGSVTGTKFGTTTNAKLGFFGTTPVVQYVATADLKDAFCGLGFMVNGGASPLNLDGGQLTAGTVSAGTVTASTVSAGFITAGTISAANYIGINVRQYLGIVLASADYVVSTANDMILATASAITVTLPACAVYTTVGGKVYNVKLGTTGQIYVTCNTADSIDGAAGVTLNQYENLCVIDTEYQASALLGGFTLGDWEYRRMITVGTASVSAALTNLPVLVKLTTANGFFVSTASMPYSSSGWDIRFGLGLTTTLNYEISSFSTASNEAYCWVQLPTVSSTTAVTTFYMYYRSVSLTSVNPVLSPDKTTAADNSRGGVARASSVYSGSSPRMWDDSTNEWINNNALPAWVRYDFGIKGASPGTAWTDITTGFGSANCFSANNAGAGWEAYRMFNDSTADGWSNNASGWGTAGDWIYINLGSAYVANGYMLRARDSYLDRTPGEWYFQGSNNTAGAWTNLDYENLITGSGVGWVANETKYFIRFSEGENTTGYQYYRWLWKKTIGDATAGYLQIMEAEISTTTGYRIAGAAQINQYRLQARWGATYTGQGPGTFQLQGADSQLSAFTALDTRSGISWTDSTWLSFTCASVNSVYYRYYQVYITQAYNSAQNYISLHEGELHEGWQQTGAVWTGAGFGNVWHLDAQPAGVASELLDSINYSFNTFYPGVTGANSLVGGATGSYATLITGALWKALQSGGTNSYCQGSDLAIYSFGTGSLDISWRMSWPTATCNGGVMSQGGGLGSVAWQIDVGQSSAGSLNFVSYNTAATKVSFAWSPASGTWYACRLTRSANTWQFWVNGATVGGDQVVAVTVGNSTYPFYLFYAMGSSTADRYLTTGALDEVRIASGIAFTTSFYQALYASELDTLLTYTTADPSAGTVQPQIRKWSIL